MNVITEEDIDRIVNAYIARKEIDKFSHVATLDEVRKNNYNCNIPRYVDSFEKETAIDILKQTQLIHNYEQLSSEVYRLLEGHFKALGIDTLDSSFKDNLITGKIRFKRDDGTDFDAWEEYTISDLFEKVKLTNQGEHNRNVITNSAVEGLIPQRDFFEKDIAVEGNTEKYTIIHRGDFVYNPRKSSSAPYGPFNCYQLDEPGIVSPLYSCLKPKEPLYTPYLLYYFASSAWHSYIYHNGNQGGARHDRVGMTDDLLMGIPVLLPCIEEQNKIVEFFDLIDKWVKIEKDKLEAIKTVKKGLLQQMFV